VKSVYETAPGQWDCVTEDGFVVYFLRVDPDYGIKRLAQAPSFCKIISKYAPVCVLLLLFPMQRLFEIASIAPNGVPISACASCTKKFSQAQSLARKGMRMGLLVSAKGVGTEVDFSRSERLR